MVWWLIPSLLLCLQFSLVRNRDPSFKVERRKHRERSGEERPTKIIKQEIHAKIDE